MQKPKTFKDIHQGCHSRGFTKRMIKEWIEFLEKESCKSFTEYPHGAFQAGILREIFDIGD